MESPKKEGKRAKKTVRINTGENMVHEISRRRSKSNDNSSKKQSIDWDFLMAIENQFDDESDKKKEDKKEDKRVVHERGYWDAEGKFIYYKKDQGLGRKKKTIKRRKHKRRNNKSKRR